MIRRGPLLSESIVAYRGEIKRRGFTNNTIERYIHELERFNAFLGANRKARHVATSSCRRFLDSFDNHEPATVALVHSILNKFFEWLFDEEVIAKNPMLKVKRPKVPPLADRKVVTVSSEEVDRMMQTAESWPERLVMGVLGFTGLRRHAASELRWRDIDLARGVLTAHEKGNKSITKPIPDELAALFVAYLGEHDPAPDDYVIPNRRPNPTGVRSDKVVYNILKTVAKRAGVNAHCHSIRAAFAVRYLESNPGRAEALQQLMGHSSIETTYGYLRRLDRAKAMETVRGLSWNQQ